MITLTDVHKRYWTSRGEEHWVLRGISYAFGVDRKVAVLGVNGAGKSTLMRLIAGTDTPTRGQVRRQCRVSWPIGLAGGVLPALTGRQNTRFVCRVHGVDDALDERVEFVRGFSELGAAFDEPVQSYSSGMRARLNFSLSLAFRFDMYLIDEVMSAGDASFQKKSRAAFEEMVKSAGLILVSHSDATLTSFCNEAVWLHDGRLHLFSSVAAALAAYRKYSVPA